ncbi:MAG: hypothetical protein JNK15_20720 [Planctomycetes bacterium]|nr:hypothetical protein [Planctomycetota bacterium]
MSTWSIFTCSVLFAVATVSAQRPTPTIEWQKRTATIEFGAVPVGKHSLAELPVGQNWRLGNNEASVLRLDLPLLAGDSVVAPGAYRIGLERTAETKAALTIAGTGLAVLGTGDGRIDGVLGKASKPSKKLDVQWRKKGNSADGGQPVQIVVTFGPDEWVGEATLLGGEAFTAQANKGVVWTLPAALLASGKALPVGQLVRGDDRWNIVAGKDEVKLVPTMRAPTEQFGFGAPVAPEASKVVAGKVGKLDAKVDAELATLDLLEARRQDGLMLAIGFAKERLSWTLPEPKSGK